MTDQQLVSIVVSASTSLDFPWEVSLMVSQKHQGLFISEPFQNMRSGTFNTRWFDVHCNTNGTKFNLDQCVVTDSRVMIHLVIPVSLQQKRKCQAKF